MTGRTTDASFEILEWDSVVFGVPVARFAASVRDEAALIRACTELRLYGVRLAYLFASSDGNDDELAYAARRLGGREVCERVTFSRELRGFVPRQPARLRELTPYEGPVTSELVQLARLAGRHSRFRVDPNVGARTFHRIYDAWIERSVSREIADIVFVASEGARITGLVTVAGVTQTAEIGLLAVDEGVRGRGLGTALVERALSWAGERALPRAAVVTQAANVEACTLYERCHYTVESRWSVFHFWL